MLQLNKQNIVIYRILKISVNTIFSRVSIGAAIVEQFVVIIDPFVVENDNFPEHST